ncbi:MAG: hypothetical protein AAGD07_17150, partial [Planctomycetota bacterium]
MKWEPQGLGGFGNMVTPAASPVVRNDDGNPNPHLLINCDMGAVYISDDLGQHWRIFHYRDLRGNTGVKPAFSNHYGQQGELNTIYAGSAFGEMKVTHDGG